MVQKVEAPSLLDVAALLAPTTWAPITDILPEMIGFKYMDHFSENTWPPLIPLQLGNMGNPAQPPKPVHRIPPPPPKRPPRTLQRNETPYVNQLILERLSTIQLWDLYYFNSFFKGWSKRNVFKYRCTNIMEPRESHSCYAVYHRVLKWTTPSPI